MADNVENIFDDVEKEDGGQELQAWVLDKSQRWRDHFESAYKPKFDEYYRIWRGEWSSQDRDRDSERSKLITPGTMQAVEENSAEVEEATFTGPLFDIRDDVDDQNPADVAKMRKKLTEDLKKAQFNTGISECILNAAIYGTGCAEIVLEETTEQAPAFQPALDGQAVSIGVQMTKRTMVKLRPILPQNFLVDPNATSPHNGLGVCIDEFVGREQVEIAQEKGIYDSSVNVGEASHDSSLEPDQSMVVYTDDRVRLTRYYGLVPRHLLDAAQAGSDGTIEVITPVEDGDDSYYVEAIVVLGNGHLLKAEANPYLMNDRPVVSFAWDIVPGRFYGRGVVEKAYNSQKAVDTEIRARIDGLALTIHPMMAIDATRMPRGAKPQIRPGKMLKVNGNPSEILQPFNFGGIDNNSFAQAESLNKMLQQATGAINAAGMPNAVAGGDVKTGAIAMALGSVMKRHKRTLLNFQTTFLIPAIEKFAWRYMQFDTENYPVGDYKFNVEGSLGLIAREYEVSQLAQLLSTMPPGDPLKSTLLRSIVENMNLTNREEIILELEKASEPNEQEMQQQQEAHAAEMATKKATLDVLNGQANEFNAKAALDNAKMENIDVENRIELAKIAANNRSPDDNTGDKEFERRLQTLDAVRKDRELTVKENESKAKIAANERAEAQQRANELKETQQRDELSE